MDTDDVWINWCMGLPSAFRAISARGLRKTTKQTGLDRKTIRAILNGKKVKTSTLAKVVIGCEENRVIPPLSHHDSGVRVFRPALS